MRTAAIASVLLLATTMAQAETPPTDGDAAFAAALHRQLAATKGNLLYSPASVRMALAMAAMGARGATATELTRALSLPAAAGSARTIGAQMADWDARDAASERTGVRLRVVNHLWAQRGHDFVADYTRTLREVFHAPLTAVDFAQQAAAARRAINDWVADATEQKIPSLIGDGVLTKYTKMVLTNAIYLKARWEAPFDPASTLEERFFVAAGRPVTVAMMHRVTSTRLARVDGAMVLELPYSDGRLAMDIVLPTARDGLAKIEAAYVKGAFDDWRRALEVADVDVSLPKLKVSSAQDLTWVLRGLGIVHATDRDCADFSGVDGTHELFIGAVVHKALLDVDEHTTEAVAATAVAEAVPSAPMPRTPIVFRADHPFLFVIRDTTQGALLFAGRIVDPTAH